MRQFASAESANEALAQIDASPNRSLEVREIVAPERFERLSRATQAARSSSRMAQVIGPGFRNVARNGWDGQRLQGADGAFGRSKFFFFVIAGTAVLAMLMTISSMGSRWINDHRAWLQDRSNGVIPPALSLPTLAGADRPIRIDAHQPHTRLGIDLAVFERAKASQARTSSGLPDSSPKAA
jgi:hypothetical protein